MSLTDDWKAERLKKEKDYFVKTLSNGKIYPAHLYDDNSFSFCGNRTEYFPENTDIECVLFILGMTFILIRIFKK